MERQTPEELHISPEMIGDFLTHLSRIGRSGGTVEVYRRHLTRLYAMLPEGKTIGPGTLAGLREELRAGGVANNTVNIFVSSANSFLDYCGRRELQLSKPLKRDTPLPPELTRAEYLRLLGAARALNKPRPYLLVKVFALTGLYVRELPLVTVEAARAGQIPATAGGMVHLSPCLSEELLRFCGEHRITSGPVFVTQEGRPLERGYINYAIQSLAGDAQVASEKCNPLALRRLYLATRETIWAGLALIAEQTHDRMVETEQLSIGWASPGV